MFLMNSADPHEPGQSAKLWTTFSPSTEAQDMCLTFWYSMTGSDTGTLQLFRYVLLIHQGFFLLGRAHLMLMMIPDVDVDDDNDEDVDDVNDYNDNADDDVDVDDDDDEDDVDVD